MLKKMFLIALFLFLAQAQALKLTLWNRDLTSKVGAAESAGNKFTVQLVRDYSGPVIALFAQTDDERKNGTYTGLLNRYDGFLKAGQLTLFLPEEKELPSSSASASVPAVTSLSKLLQPYKLSVTVQLSSLFPDAAAFSALGNTQRQAK